MKLIGIAILLTALAGIALAQIQWDHTRLESAQRRTRARELVKSEPSLVDSEKATATEFDMIKKLVEIVRLQATQIAELELRVKKLEGAKAETRE